MPGIRIPRVDPLLAHLRDPLHRNAYALILNTGITSILGALATVIMTRTYAQEDVGRGAALVAAMQLLSTITQLNLSSALTRFLPEAGVRAGQFIRFTYRISMALAVVLTSVVLMAIHFLAPDGYALRMSFGLSLVFIAATAAYSVFNLQDAAITGLRRTIWVPIENAVFGLLKIVLLVALASLGAYGILGAWVIPLVAMIIPANYAILYWLRRADLREQSRLPDRRSLTKFVAGDFPGTLFAQLSTTFVPLVVVSVLGETETAYFVAAQTIAFALDLAVLNFASSFTVEAASDHARRVELARKTLKQMARVLLPLIAVVVVLAPYILSVFKPEYAAEATTLLRLLALTTILKIFSGVFGALARLDQKTHRIAVLSAIQATFLLGGGSYLMTRMGITGIGVAALVGQAVTSIYVVPYVLRFCRRPPVEEVSKAAP